MRLIATLLAILTVSTTLSAEERGYLAFNGGLTRARDQKWEVYSGDVIQSTVTGKLKDGWKAGIVFGADVFCGLRAEIEGHYTKQDFDSLLGSAGLTAIEDLLEYRGRQHLISGTANVYCDFVTPVQFLVPFVGGGVGMGYTYVEFPDNADSYLQQLATALGQTFSNNRNIQDKQLAWQLMGGVHILKDCCYFANVFVRWWNIYPRFRYVLNDSYVLFSRAEQFSLEATFSIYW